MVQGQVYIVDVTSLPNQALIIFDEWLKMCVCTEKKDLIESKKIICLNDFLWFKEMICLNET